jgi:hypothetical protein
VSAESSGIHPGTITYDDSSKTATFDPDSSFHKSEIVSVMLTAGIRSSQGIPMDSSYAWSFTTNMGRGDLNEDGIIDISDAIFLLNYLYRNDQAPDPLEVGDVNCDELVDLQDAIYLINYLFRNGPPPGC